MSGQIQMVPCPDCDGAGHFDIEGSSVFARKCSTCNRAGMVPAAEGCSFDDYLPLRAVRTAPGEYDITDRDGCVLWRMEGAALAEWVCDTVNARAALDALKEWRAADKEAQRKVVEFVGGGFVWQEYNRTLDAVRAAVDVLIGEKG